MPIRDQFMELLAEWQELRGPCEIPLVWQMHPDTMTAAMKYLPPTSWEMELGNTKADAKVKIEGHYVGLISHKIPVGEIQLVHVKSKKYVGNN